MDGYSEHISNIVCVLMNYDVWYCATLQYWSFGMSFFFTMLTIAKAQSKHRCSQYGLKKKNGGFSLVTIVWFSV